MIDCLYTGPATDSQDCWWGEVVRPYICVPWSAYTAITKALRAAADQDVVTVLHSAFDWKKPAKATESLQDRVPEKG